MQNVKLPNSNKRLRKEAMLFAYLLSLSYKIANLFFRDMMCRKDKSLLQKLKMLVKYYSTILTVTEIRNEKSFY